MENHQIARRVALLAGHGAVSFAFVNEALEASRVGNTAVMPWLAFGIVLSAVGAALAYSSLTASKSAQNHERYSLFILAAWCVSLFVMALLNVLSG